MRSCLGFGLGSWVFGSVGLCVFASLRLWVFASSVLGLALTLVLALALALAFALALKGTSATSFCLPHHLCSASVRYKYNEGFSNAVKRPVKISFFGVSGK